MEARSITDATKHPELTQYAGDGRGARATGFTIDGIAVAVRPDNDDQNEAAWNLAGELSTARLRQARADETIAKLRAQVADLRAQIPPSRGAQLLGRGFVRFCGEGNREMWVLNNRERGLGEFGYRIESWDDLFRRYNVRVVEHGTDEHGPWWAVENFA